MATRAQIIVLLACASLADCRSRGIFNKPILPTELKIQEANTKTVNESLVVPKIKNNEDVIPEKINYDEDAIVFPKDEDVKTYLDVNKIFKQKINKIGLNTRKNAASTTRASLLPKVVPAVEAKEVFTNPIINKGAVAHKNKDDIKIQANQNLIQETKELIVADDAVMQDNFTIALDNNMTAVMSNDTSSNVTVPDFSSRFGVTGNYLLVPANNFQAYQAVQVPNVPVQENVQQYGTYGEGNIATSPTNAYPQYTTNAIIANMPYTQNEPYVTPNVHPVVQQGTNVPISVGNTYMINGQLYAAVTVPNNVNVPSSVYLVNSRQPQGQRYQVNNNNNNVPVYKLVSIGQGEGNVDSQYIPIN